MSHFPDQENEDKKYNNSLFVNAIAVIFANEGVNPVVFYLDGPDMRTTQEYMLAGLPIDNVTISEINFDNYLRQIKFARRFGMPQHHIHHDSADAIIMRKMWNPKTCRAPPKPQIFNAVYLDFMSTISGRRGYTADPTNAKFSEKRCEYSFYPLQTVVKLLKNHQSPVFILALTFCTRSKTGKGMQNARVGEYKGILENVFTVCRYRIIETLDARIYQNISRETHRNHTGNMWYGCFVLEFDAGINPANAVFKKCKGRSENYQYFQEGFNPYAD